MQDYDIDSPLPLFPQHQPPTPGLPLSPDTIHKPLMKLIKQRMHKPRRLTHKSSRKPHKKKVV